MLNTSLDACEAILKTDPSVTPGDRTAMLALLRKYEQNQTATELTEEDQILSRRATRDRFFPGRSLRYLDKLAAEGVLRKVKIPGRSRSVGFNAAHVRKLVAGRGQEGTDS